MQTIAPSGEQEMTWSGHLLLLADRSLTVAQLRLMLQCCVCRLLSMTLCIVAERCILESKS